MEQLKDFSEIKGDVIQSETTEYGPAILVLKDQRYHFYLRYKGQIYSRQVDAGDSFTLSKIARWLLVTEKLSKKKRQMRIPAQCIIRAVGFEPVDVDKFLDNEGKNGLSGRLRQLEWFNEAHYEIKTALLKLFAHLDLFTSRPIDERMKVIEQIRKQFSLLEIHNLFGGLIPGIDFKSLLKRQDSATHSCVRRFDPDGKKAITFFLQHMEEKDIACFILTHYAQAYAWYEGKQKAAMVALETNAFLSINPQIRVLAATIQAKKQELASAMYACFEDKEANSGEVGDLQTALNVLREQLYVLARGSDMNQFVRAIDRTRQPFGTADVRLFRDDGDFSLEMSEEMKALARQAGYRRCDEWELKKLLEVYHTRPSPKYFCTEQKDRCHDSPYFYQWLSGNDPELYFMVMLCGNTCMRPGFAGEAALWECALSPDVAICAIRDKENRFVAYLRVNYDAVGQGFYIDTVESRFPYVLNNEHIWQTVSRAVIDMALFMNSIGAHPVKVINFREEKGNRLKIQWAELPASKYLLKARRYIHTRAPWPYGDDDPRVQKVVWYRDDPLAFGSNAKVYGLETDKILKLFADDYKESKIVQECANSFVFQNAGLPVPCCFGLRERGIVYEKIYGESLTDKVKKTGTGDWLKKMARLARQIHQTKIDQPGLPSAKDQYMAHLLQCQNYLSTTEYQFLVDFVRSIPDTTNLLHGDFHTGNILVRNGELVLIDFAESCYGHPIFDVIAEGAVLPLSDGLDKYWVESYLGLSVKEMTSIWRSFVKAYLADKPSKSLDDLIWEARVIACLRNVITPDITHGIPEQDLARYIRDIMKTINANRQVFQNISWSDWL